jgi:hypothetical protein
MPERTVASSRCFAASLKRSIVPFFKAYRHDGNEAA